jgi:hypothetical protein
MIVSSPFKFVYIDIPKTGSISLDAIFKELPGSKVIRLPKPEINSKHNRIIPDYAKNYTVVASVRNPFDRATSRYYWDLKRGRLWNSFEEYMEFCISTLKHPSNTIDGGIYGYFPCWKYLEPIQYDYIIRVESMLEDLKALPFLNNPRDKKRNVNKHPSWEEIQTKELEEMVLEWGHKDLEEFYNEN